MAGFQLVLSYFNLFVFFKRSPAGDGNELPPAMLWHQAVRNGVGCMVSFWLDSGSKIRRTTMPPAQRRSAMEPHRVTSVCYSNLPDLYQSPDRLIAPTWLSRVRQGRSPNAQITWITWSPYLLGDGRAHRFHCTLRISRCHGGRPDSGLPSDWSTRQPWLAAGIWHGSQKHRVAYTSQPTAMNLVMITGSATALFGSSPSPPKQKRHQLRVPIQRSVNWDLISFRRLGLAQHSLRASFITWQRTHFFKGALLFPGQVVLFYALSWRTRHAQRWYLRKHSPITSATFWSGALAISGIPPSAGLFQKRMRFLPMHFGTTWSSVWGNCNRLQAGYSRRYFIHCPDWLHRSLSGDAVPVSMRMSHISRITEEHLRRLIGPGIVRPQVDSWAPEAPGWIALAEWIPSSPVLAQSVGDCPTVRGEEHRPPHLRKQNDVPGGTDVPTESQGYKVYKAHKVTRLRFVINYPPTGSMRKTCLLL